MLNKKNRSFVILIRCLAFVVLNKLHFVTVGSKMIELQISVFLQNFSSPTFLSNICDHKFYLKNLPEKMSDITWKSSNRKLLFVHNICHCGNQLINDWCTCLYIFVYASRKKSFGKNRMTNILEGIFLIMQMFWGAGADDSKIYMWMKLLSIMFVITDVREYKRLHWNMFENEDLPILSWRSERTNFLKYKCLRITLFDRIQRL